MRRIDAKSIVTGMHHHHTVNFFQFDVMMIAICKSVSSQIPAKSLFDAVSFRSSTFVQYALVISHVSPIKKGLHLHTPLSGLAERIGNPPVCM